MALVSVAFVTSTFVHMEVQYNRSQSSLVGAVKNLKLSTVLAFILQTLGGSEYQLLEYQTQLFMLRTGVYGSTGYQFRMF